MWRFMWEECVGACVSSVSLLVGCRYSSGGEKDRGREIHRELRTDTAARLKKLAIKASLGRLVGTMLDADRSDAKIGRCKVCGNKTLHRNNLS